MKLTHEQRGQTIARIAEAVFANCAASIFNAGYGHDGVNAKELDRATEFSVRAASALVNYVEAGANQEEGP